MRLLDNLNLNVKPITGILIIILFIFFTSIISILIKYSFFIISLMSIFVISTVIFLVFITSQNILKVNFKNNNAKKYIVFKYFLNENLNRRFKDEDSIFLINNYERIVKKLKNKSNEVSINRDFNLTDEINHQPDIENFAFTINQMLNSIDNIFNQKNILFNKTFYNFSELNNKNKHLFLLKKDELITSIKDNFNVKTFQASSLEQDNKQFKLLDHGSQSVTDNIEKADLLKKEVEILALKLKTNFSVFKCANNKNISFYNKMTFDLNERLKIKKLAGKLENNLGNRKKYNR